MALRLVFVEMVDRWNLLRLRINMRTFLLGICFACIVISSSHIVAREHVDGEAMSIAEMEKELSRRIASASGADEIECVARSASNYQPYNYTFSRSNAAIRGRQWCCLTPDMHDIVKVKHAPRNSTQTPETTISHTTTDLNTKIIVGRDGSEWRIPLKEKWSWKCLPSFIVAGTQKSGSTALSAYLLAHPQVSMGRSKEIHFFDKPMPLGLLPYLINFASVDGTNGMGVLDQGALREFTSTSQHFLTVAPPFISGEATPFYIADRDVCRHIKESLPEVPALIVLVRDPVSRVYSEYMMKQRRVETQDEFLDILNQNAWPLLQCLTRSLHLPMGSYGANSSYVAVGVDGCVPEELSTHSKWKDVKKALRERTASSAKSTSNTSPLDSLLLCFYTEEALEEEPIYDRSSLPSGTFSTQVNITWARPKYYLKRSNLNDLSFLKAANQKRSVPMVLFDVKRCVPRGLREHFPSTDVFLKEIDGFIKCAGDNFDKDIASLDYAVNRCVKVHHGISDQFIYRSMYASQLYQCFKFIPKHKVLVLDSHKLKDNPHKVLKQVHEHLGIADFDYHDILNAENPKDRLQQVFDSYYPSFEQRTGWRMDGDYEPMNDELRERLGRFFKNQNKLLEELVGQSFEW